MKQKKFILFVIHYIFNSTLLELLDQMSLVWTSAKCNNLEKNQHMGQLPFGNQLQSIDTILLVGKPTNFARRNQL